MLKKNTVGARYSELRNHCGAHVFSDNRAFQNHQKEEVATDFDLFNSQTPIMNMSGCYFNYPQVFFFPSNISGAPRQFFYGTPPREKILIKEYGRMVMDTTWQEKALNESN